ncbi:MAG: FAD:protein FMN transferase, partial [Planctomycetaceae bacterium]
HIVDPKTGLGLTRRSSVTVIAPTGWQADSLASALSVLGPDRGLLLSTGRRGVEISVTILRDGKPVTTQTCGFRRYGNAK